VADSVHEEQRRAVTPPLENDVHALRLDLSYRSVTVTAVTLPGAGITSCSSVERLVRQWSGGRRRPLRGCAAVTTGNTPGEQAVHRLLAWSFRTDNFDGRLFGLGPRCGKKCP
jgi:hypothetical protein